MGGVRAQVALVPSAGGKILILPTDAAVLADPADRKDLACVVTAGRVELGLDLRFHTAYSIRIPLRELAGESDQLRVLLRLTPVGRPDQPAFLTDRIQVPPIPEDARGETTLEGRFALGEGRYRVDWLMRDRSERVCSAHWEAVAERADSERELALLLPPNTVAAEPTDPFHDEPPVERRPAGSLLRVLVLANVAPQRARAVTMRPRELDALAAILREIAREPRIGQFSLVAFNARQQQVLFRQSDAPRIDFPALGAALDALNLGVVDYRHMQEKNPEAEFFTSLVEEELGAADRPQAVIFVGPKLNVEGVSPDDWKGLAPQPAVFYMNYNPFPAANPWTDAITSLVRTLRGRVYSISRPSELAAAWRDLMGRVTRSGKAAD